MNKMRIILLLIFMIVTSLKFFAQKDSVGNDLNYMNLNGKVKSVKEVSYKADIQSETLTNGKKERDADISYGEDSYIEFNKQGNKIQHVYYNSNEKENLKRVYKYDSIENLIEVRWYEEGALTSKSIYRYNDKRENVEVSKYNYLDTLEHKWIIRYDINGAKLEELRYNSNAKIILRRVYKYDNNGNKIGGYQYDLDSNLTAKWTYNQMGNQSEYYWYNSDGSSNGIEKSEFDVNGNIEKQIWYDSNGSIKRESTYLYEYDTHKNWIRQVSYFDGKAQYILERTISYYK